jgi:hypothetical protein
MLTIIAVSAVTLFVTTLVAPAVLVQLWVSRDVNPPERREAPPISTLWALESNG